MIQPLIHDESILKKKSISATKKDLSVAYDLLDTLKYHQKNCAGMAANMIGINKNIIAINLGFAFVVMINAKITKKQHPYQTEEGCLSYLNGPTSTTRYQEIEVDYLDMEFKPHHSSFSGFTAQIIQHELDHVNGKLI